MDKLYVKKEDCTGCTACKSICSTNAITMEADGEGFLYPKIDTSLCIDCRKCEKVCSYAVNETKIGPLAYGVIHKNEEVRRNSSSGGAYTAISDYFLNNSGVIYGAEFTGEFNVHHNRGVTLEERERFKGSKYVMSNLEDTFRKAACDLMKGLNVLFTGTPCQTNGLLKYLTLSGIDHSRLILNDIICFGAGAPAIWRDYLGMVQRRKKLKSYNFRNKEKGWRGFHIKAVYEDGTVRTDTPDLKIYPKLYNKRYILRPACHSCRYTNMDRPSDITIGDFWGIEKDDNKGVSLVFINTTKGQELFDKIKDDFLCFDTDIKECLQPSLVRPSPMPSDRGDFWKLYKHRGFSIVSVKYGDYDIISRVKFFMKGLIKK